MWPRPETHLQLFISGVKKLNLMKSVALMKESLYKVQPDKRLPVISGSSTLRLFLISSVFLSCLEAQMLEAVTSKKSCVRHCEPVTMLPKSQEKPRLGSSQQRRHRALLPSAPEYRYKLDPRPALLSL